jgi:hypothetical protein
MTVGSKAWIALAIGSVTGLLLRATLPSDRGGLSFLWGGTFHVVPINRVAFWLCIVAAVVAAVVLAAKSPVAP